MIFKLLHISQLPFLSYAQLTFQARNYVVLLPRLFFEVSKSLETKKIGLNDELDENNEEVGLKKIDV